MSIRIDLTKQQQRTAQAGHVDLTEEQLKSAWGSFRGHKGGRPTVLRPCPYCGVELGARALRAHMGDCVKRWAR